MAKGQLKRIAAEETRAAATEKAKLAEQEKARLAAEGAQQAEQAKAAAAAKAAEQARMVAEKAKQLEQEKAAAAEKARQAEQEKVRLAAEKTKQAEQEKAAAAEQARLAAEKAASEKKQLAAVSPADKQEQPAVDLPRALQAELRRVGCITGAVDGNWNAASQKALDLFNKHTGLKIDVKVASSDALDAVRAKPTRVCPLICDRGYKADRDRCMKITCRAGYQVGDDNTCEKIEVKTPTAKREEPKRDRSERAKVEAAPAKPQASGQIICTQSGCRPVAKGCRLEANRPGVAGSSGANHPIIEVCN